MKTIKEFMDWCNANPNIKIYQLPVAEWEIVDNWRWAIGANTANEVESSVTPGTIMMWLNASVKLLGTELLDDIQRTYDEQ